MPRRVRYRTALFEELERQLAFAPAEATRRQMEAAERLAADIDPGGTYPFEFVEWRITGFRRAAGGPQPIRGVELRADLATFVLRASERIDLPAAEREGGALTLAEAAASLGVAEKTVRRWRERGLLCHRLRFPDGRSRVGVFRGEWTRFASQHAGLVTEARSFSRMDDGVSGEAVRRTTELIGQGLTANLAARQVARELGRSHEAIRQLLLRREPTLLLRPRHARREPLARERLLAFRAWRRGIPVERIAERRGTTVDTIRRRIGAERAERLRRLSLAWIEFPTFARADAEATVLGADAARRGLAPRSEPAEAIALLEAVAADGADGASDSAAEEAMLAAYSFLKRRAAGLIAGFGRAPDQAVVDRVETDLRWAVRLKRRLVERFLGAAVRRIEQALGGPLLRRPAEEIRSLLERSVEVVGATVEHADPSRRQAPRRVIALETDRLCARLGLEARASRAAVRHERGTLPTPDLFERIVPWGDLPGSPGEGRPPTLGRIPSPGRLAALPTAEASLLARRYGWGDHGPPLTLVELAGEERTTVALVTRRVADAERALRALP